MTRVCLLTTSFPRFPDDEASVFLQRLVEGYSGANARGIVIVPRDQNEQEQSTCAAFQVYRFRYGIFRRGALAFGAGIMPNLRQRPTLIFQAPMLLLQLIIQAVRRRNEYDVVHANWALALLAAWISSFLTAKPYIVTLRGEDIPLLQMALMKFFCRAALHKASKIVSVNEQFVSDIKKIASLSAQKCIVIPNGVSVSAPAVSSVESLLASRGLTSGEYMLFVGTVIPRKRVDVLIRALTLPSLARYQLVICGRLDQAECVENLRKLAGELGVSERVTFEGAVAPSKIPLYLSGSAFYISASAFEGRPNAVLEALASGKVVVASNIAAHAEIIRHAENGFLFDAEKLASLEMVLGDFLQSTQRRASIQAAAVESTKNLSWDTCARHYVSVFEHLE